MRTLAGLLFTNRKFNKTSTLQIENFIRRFNSYQNTTRPGTGKTRAPGHSDTQTKNIVATTVATTML